MSLTLLEKDMNIISSLEDEPNDVGGMSAAELKAAFDEGNVAVKEFLNNTLIAELEALGVNKLVQYGSDTIKQIRVNEEGGLDVSPDGLVWATILGSSGGTTAIGALTFNGTTYYPTNYVVTLPGTAAIGALTFNGTTYYPTDYLVTLPSMFVGYGSCSTASSTAAKTTTIENFALVTGAMVTVRFTNSNTASNATLNVNGTGAKTLRYNNANVTTKTIRSGYIAALVYDGTYWQIITMDGFAKTRFEVVTYTGTGSLSKTVSTSLPSARAGFISGNSRIMFKFGVGSGTAALGTATYTGYYTDWSFSGTSLTVTTDDTAGYAMNSSDASYSVIFWE